MIERLQTVGGIVAAGAVEVKRVDAAGGVVEAGGVADERREAAGGAAAAGSVVLERAIGEGLAGRGPVGLEKADVARHPGEDGGGAVERLELDDLAEDRPHVGRRLREIRQWQNGLPWRGGELHRETEPVGDGVERMRDAGDIRYLVAHQIIGEPLQLPGYAVGDESVLADGDDAHHRRERGGGRVASGVLERRERVAVEFDSRTPIGL